MFIDKPNRLGLLKGETMAYTVITTFPKEDTQENEKLKTSTHKETIFDQELDQVLNLYEGYERSGYKVSVAYDSGEVEDKTPFEIANDLDNLGIEYVAKFKFLEKSNSGTHEKIVELCGKIEQHGFYKYRVDVQLKIDEDSTVDINRETSWFAPDDTTYKVTPDVKSKNANELLGLYEDLRDSGYLVDIEIKPKNNKDDDFATKLNAFPDGTIIKFNLSDVE